MALICSSALNHDLADIHSVVSLQSLDEYSRPIGWLSESGLFLFIVSASTFCMLKLKIGSHPNIYNQELEINQELLAFNSLNVSLLLFVTLAC